MDDLLACRVCLIMDVKMYNLRSSPLNEYFRSIFEVNPHTHKFLTQVCAECAVLIRKFYIFREKCKRGINVLEDMLTNNAQLTKSNLESIDREHYKLTSTISRGLPQSNHEFSLDYGDELPIQQVNVREYIKQEVVDDFSHDLIIKVEEIEVEQEMRGEHEINDDEKKIVEFNVPITNKIRKPLIKRKPRVLKERQARSVRNTKDIRKTRNIKNVTRKPSELDPNTKRSEIVQSLDKEISKHFDVITPTLEEQRADIEARQYTASYQNASLKCSICFKVFVYQKAYDLHMKKHDPCSGPIVCEVCEFRFRERRELAKHRILHTHRYACKLCPRVLITRANADSHQLWHTKMKFTCEHCPETFTHPTSYLSHLRIKHPSNNICNLCGYSYLTVLGLKQHKSRMHKDQMECELTGPSCDKCDIQFMNHEAFDRHFTKSSNHIGEQSSSTSCRQCGETFTDPVELKAHIKKLHPYEKHIRITDICEIEWPKKCDHCDVMIPSAKENWYHHQRDHREKEYNYTAGNVFICETCGYKTANSVSLSYHVKEKHSSHHPHVCPHCAKTFGTPHKYKMHLRTHSDQKPYSCTKCSLSFTTKGYLQRHVKTHSGLRPHSCQICHKTFATTTTRNSHVKYVHYKAPPPSRNKHMSLLKKEKMKGTLKE